MAVTVSSQAITTGAFGTFTVKMGLGGVDGFYRSVVMLGKLDETMLDPTTLATSANQPGLGTAGAANANVLTVQGIAAMTPILVNGSGVTQPVSGTVALGAGAAAVGTVGVTALPAIPTGANTIGAVNVNGTVPTSLASLPALAAGTNSIGSVLGKTTMSLQTPVVTSNGQYTGGNELGTLMTFPVGGAGTGGELKSITITSKTPGLTTGIGAYVFTANPTTSTWTDKINPAINTVDIAKLLCGVVLTENLSDLGTMTIWSASNLGYQFSAANLYVVLVVKSTITLTSTSVSDITVELGMRVD